MDKDKLKDLIQTQARGTLDGFSISRGENMRSTLVSLIESCENKLPAQEISTHIKNGGDVNALKTYDINLALGFETLCNKCGIPAVVVIDIESKSSYFITKDIDVPRVENLLSKGVHPTGLILKK